MKMGEYFAWMALTAWLILFDQISDHIGRIMLPLVRTVEVGSFFNIALLFNPVAGLGLPANVWQAQRYLTILVAMVVSALFARSILSELRWRYKVAYVLLMGGAASIAIDHVFNRVVTDLFGLDLSNAYWFAFNLADCWIVLGCLLMLIASMHRIPPSNLDETI